MKCGSRVARDAVADAARGDGRLRRGRLGQEDAEAAQLLRAEAEGLIVQREGAVGRVDEARAADPVDVARAGARL